MKYEHRSNWTRDYGVSAPHPGSAHREHALVPATSMLAPPETFSTGKLKVEPSGAAVRAPRSYRSVLVPVDGSPFGEHALPLALGVARRAGAEVRVVHIHRPMRSTFAPGRSGYESSLDLYLRRRQRDYLADLCRRLAPVARVPVTPVFREAPDVTDALYSAARYGTDLVVMATHGRGPLGRFWIGSVADELLRRLPVPLLLTRGYDAPVDLTGDPLLRHVLIPLNGSPLAEEVLEPAIALGAPRGADHTLLRVVPFAPDAIAHGALETDGSPAAEHGPEAWEYVRRLANGLDRRGVRARPGLVRSEESVAAAILHYARDHEADLIALATRAPTGLARLFRVSVADRLVRRAHVPVLVLHPDGKDVS